MSPAREEKMDIYAVIGVGIVGAALAVLLAQHRKEYALMVSLAAGAVILLSAARGAYGVTGEMERYIAAAGIDREWLENLFKCLGICIVSQFAADTCRDSGQGAIASKVELAGKVAAAAAALPLFRELIGLALRMVEL